MKNIIKSIPTKLNQSKIYFWASNFLPINFSLISFFLISLTLLIIIRMLGTLWGVPFTFWYDDCGLLLLTVGTILIFYGITWDFLVIFTFLLSKSISKIKPNYKYTRLKIIYRDIGFFSIGAIPIFLVLFTSYVILETSNITLISLKISGSLIPWRDAFFWNIERDIFNFLSIIKPNVFYWDILYNSAWAIEILAIFILITTSRNNLIVLKFCSSFISLFYIGRLIGLLNPVKGPAFYKPELFSYLEGTYSLKAMVEIYPIMAADPLSLKSGILVGGVSAMPSLHIGMVFLTSYWLSTGFKYFKFITPFWVILVWISTVLLGWHYVFDGLGGLVLGLLCIWLNKLLFKAIENIQ